MNLLFHSFITIPATNSVGFFLWSNFGKQRTVPQYNDWPFGTAPSNAETVLYIASSCHLIPGSNFNVTTPSAIQRDMETLARRLRRGQFCKRCSVPSPRYSYGSALSAPCLPICASTHRIIRTQWGLAPCGRWRIQDWARHIWYHHTWADIQRDFITTM